MFFKCSILEGPLWEMAKNFPTFLGRIANLAEIMISIFTYVKIFEMEMQHIVKVVLILDPLKIVLRRMWCDF